MVGDLIQAAGYQVFGFVDGDPVKVGQVVEPLAALVTHHEDELREHLCALGTYPEGVDACALGIGDNRLRQLRLKDLDGFVVPPLAHPSASVSSTAQLGRGCVVFPHAVVNAGAQVNDAVIVNSGAIVEHDCVLESGVHISPGAVLCGGVRVGQRSWVGAGATVIHGVTIGKDSIVGAGSTVIHDVGDSETVIGSPARSSKS